MIKYWCNISANTFINHKYCENYINISNEHISGNNHQTCRAYIYWKGCLSKSLNLIKSNTHALHMPFKWLVIGVQEVIKPVVKQFRHNFCSYAERTCDVAIGEESYVWRSGALGLAWLIRSGYWLAKATCPWRCKVWGPSHQELMIS